MKKVIILPAYQTEGMYGYAAIGIVLNPENQTILQNMVDVFQTVRGVDSDISTIVYDNPKLDIVLFNDEFEETSDLYYVNEFNDKELDVFTEEGDCRVNSPSVIISSYQIKIVFEAKYTDSQVYCDFIFQDLIKFFEEN